MCDCCNTEDSFVRDQDGACASCRHEEDSHFEAQLEEHQSKCPHPSIDKEGICSACGKQMPGYVCFYNGARIELYAKSQWDAKQAAIAEFGKRRPIPQSKRHLVYAELAEINGKPVIHQGSELG